MATPPASTAVTNNSGFITSIPTYATTTQLAAETSNPGFGQVVLVLGASGSGRFAMSQATNAGTLLATSYYNNEFNATVAVYWIQIGSAD